MLEQLWKAAIVLRYRPGVWIPFIVAESMAVLLTCMHRRLAMVILGWVTERDSVLGGQSYLSLSNPGVLHKAILLSSPIGITLNFVQVSLLLAAFLLTVRFVQCELGNDAPDLATVRNGFQGYLKRILWFSCQVCFWYVLLAAAGSALFQQGRVEDLFSSTTHSPNLFVPLIVLIETLASAWIIAPLAIRFLQPAGGVAVDSQLKDKARRLAMFCTALNVVLYYAYEVFRVRVRFSSAFPRFAVGWLATLFVEIPFLFFFVAAALLIAEPIEMPEPVLAELAD